MKFLSKVSFERTCTIELTSSLKNSIAVCLKPYSHVILVYDQNTAIFRDEIDDAVGDVGLTFDSVILASAGEASKSFDHYAKLVNDSAGLKFLRRKSCFVAVGGGSVMDLVGFVSATFQRGVSYINIPTTLLGMVDAGVGGKTAINLPEGKHLLGAFHYPKAVIIDSTKLLTLSDRIYGAAFSEIVKVALISGNPYLFEYLESHVLLAKARDADVMSEIISKSIEVKLKLVEPDWQEENLDRLLNLGHEVAHALEAAAQFDDNQILHGEAVMVGLICACKLALKKGLINGDTYNRIVFLLSELIDFELPKELCDPTLLRKQFEVVAGIRDGDLRVVLPDEKLGNARILHNISIQELIDTLQEYDSNKGNHVLSTSA